ncbi:hypothetical protein J6590_036034 [Homalodisca vitripennis]|nr:hypothetical protein J6590_036034 [Homalodisca vitripennis]
MTPSQFLYRSRNTRYWSCTSTYVLLILSKLGDAAQGRKPLGRAQERGEIKTYKSIAHFIIQMPCKQIDRGTYRKKKRHLFPLADKGDIVSAY